MLATVKEPGLAQLVADPCAAVMVSPTLKPAANQLVVATKKSSLPPAADDTVIAEVANVAVATYDDTVAPPISSDAANETVTAPPLAVDVTLTSPGMDGTRPGTTPPRGSLAGIHVLVATPPGHDAYETFDPPALSTQLPCQIE